MGAFEVSKWFTVQSGEEATNANVTSIAGSNSHYGTTRVSSSMARVNRPLMPHRVTLSIAVLFLLAPLRAAFALQTDEIALIVNSNEPAGRQLAQLYATARHIPDNRILELDLPRSDELPFKVYEEQVVPEVREFLRTGHLDAQIKCFVTFYGVPLRIANRVSNAAEGDELDRIRITLRQTVEKLVDPVRKMEELAIRLDPSFHPNTGTDWDHLRIRAEAAFQSVNTQLATFPDPHRGAEVAIELLTALEPLSGMNATVKRAAMEAKLHPTSQPATQQAALESLVDRFRNAIQKKTELEQQRFDPKARDQLRHVVAQNFGTLQWMQLLRDQADYLTTTDSGAAFDSELAMVRLSTYSRSRWRDNPLYYAARRSNEVGATCMVMRLDAPTPDLVKGIIADSIGTEARGLTGKVVLDSRGMGSDTAHAERGLAEYDQSIRDLADLIHQRTIDVNVDGD